MNAVRMQHIFIAIILLFWGTLACPFFRGNGLNADFKPGSRNGTVVHSEAVKRGTKCAKTNLIAPNPSKQSTCSAFHETQAYFSGLVLAQVVPKSVLFGSVIRLVFHDAGEVDVSKAYDRLGPDGCLASDGSSDGLTESDSIVQLYLEPIYQQVCDRISRADFWVLLGKLVLEAAIIPLIRVPFQYGRRDNTVCEGGAGRLPGAEGGLAEVRRVFVTQMGLSMNDAVTLMGAHSLGHTHIKASGYGFRTASTTNPDLLNAWDDTPAILDNGYFIKLIGKSWQALPTENQTKQQWRHQSDPFVMVNADMALAYPINPDPPLPPPPPPSQQQQEQDKREGKPQQCHTGSVHGRPKCKRPLNRTVPETWPLCQAYARDNNLFQLAFVAAYTRMTCVGYGVPGLRDCDTASGKLGTLTTIDLSTC